MRSNRAGAMGLVGLFMLAAMLLFTLLGPALIPYDPAERSGSPLAAPGNGHLLGTNDIGQDILAELATGARVSLTIGLVGALASMLIGVAIGVLAGYRGGWADTLLMRLVDVSLTLPFLPLMIVIGVFLGPSMSTQILVIAILMWAKVARELRSQILSVRTRGPVQAARAMGAGDLYILRRHILPMTVPLMIPQFIQAVTASILMESSLSFLGLGDPLAKSWGSILFYANARSAFLTDAWIWWVVPPGLCIVWTVLGCSFVGYWLEERVSPRLQSYTALGKITPKKTAGRPASAARTGGESAALRIDGLSVRYPKAGGEAVAALRDIDLAVHPAEIVGIVGESGSGKTTMASAIMQMLKPPAARTGSIRLGGDELTALSDRELRAARGRRIALIPQAAMNALNPVWTVRKQLTEAIRCHRKLSRADTQARIEQLLGQVGIEPRYLAAYPHELSGGMRQRVVIAMALVNEPSFVIADEPTTGLDVLVQVEIIALLKKLQQELGLSMIFISHDLPVVKRIADRIVILDRGSVVDEGTPGHLSVHSGHPYTRKLMDAIPSIGGRQMRQEVQL
ncbi:dipeptide/oligopeptide/nickel ABC transporter permease/ATP-binding protein [Cohnella fermenti]|uniref:Dipeptide/oligopeptide/nickel ABC transporter permease/ATP-binding protein n=1 Tax=Cohnella fermenti TaxID=2565925 RepID=A0A4S4BSL9_9BACL|nr:dipeptide/oligopeptide/nickel ABC transporter permease/ATP-binding protein [Cohnella fermenti]THF75754.1 dipeptide/oligopeptide/nickel ABC transporter permease/ATP-binding protein [Cohnella fermenti]